MILPRDTIYITNVKPQVVIDVAGHLIEFLIDSGGLEKLAVIRNT